MVPTSTLRARFAASLSAMYGREVPAYTTLVEVTEEVNRDVMHRDGADAERLGTLARVSAERHGAIRVGTPNEMRSVATIFAAFGMYPVGFYDLRDAATPIPVVSTAFRPVDPDELSRNPFRVFTSLLVTDDRRFFGPELQERLETFLDERTLFSPELLELAEQGDLDDSDADRFVELATAAFEIGSEPVDREWYDTLEAVSSVAADIGGVTTTHINHLTPRVLDIDELYTRMQDRGIEMIDRIQGPPRTDGPAVLLRQTSFRALAEPRTFRSSDASVYTDSLRVRFGEVEARGIALTEKGRTIYDADGDYPDTEPELAAQDIGYFTYSMNPDRPQDDRPADLATAIRGGWLIPNPIVYEDFLPASAAGIFRSNLTGDGAKDDAKQGSPWSVDRMSEVIGRTVADPHDLYRAQSTASLQAMLRDDTLGSHS
ncbi:2-oxoadipate dioxygenase/decarboxylase [Rhodococcoides trifolii]|nr:VOC family protein [Rhodococcus trifolii]